VSQNSSKCRAISLLQFASCINCSSQLRENKQKILFFFKLKTNIKLTPTQDNYLTQVFTCHLRNYDGRGNRLWSLCIKVRI